MLLSNVLIFLNASAQRISYAGTFIPGDYEPRVTYWTEGRTAMGPHMFTLSIQEQSSSNCILKIRTEQGAHRWVEASCKRESSYITVSIDKVLTNNTGGILCAGVDKDLGRLTIGNYSLRVIHDTDTIKGIIEVKDEYGILTLDKGGFVSVDSFAKFTRIPGNTLWGFVLYGSKRDSSIHTDYLKLLKEQGGHSKKLPAGNYYAFNVDAKHNPVIHGNTHGWVCEEGFVFHYSKSFEELKQLTRNFIHKKGDDNVDVILTNDKGEWFSEVR